MVESPVESPNGVDVDLAKGASCPIVNECNAPIDADHQELFCKNKWKNCPYYIAYSLSISHDYNVPEAQRKIELIYANKIRAKNRFKVLDICCRRFPRGFGVDLHPESNADLRCDAHDLSVIPDKSFDLTLCVEGIEHLINPGKAVIEWARATKYALAITTQNAHCWRRWVRIPNSLTKIIKLNPCTSPDHIYMWDEFTFRNFFNRLLPEAKVEIDWYDRYLKKTRNFKPSRFFHENLKAFIWLNPEDMTLYDQIRKESMQLLEFRPPHLEYSNRKI